MKNRSIGNVGQVVQDWDENILFEADSTDFCSELSESASTALAEMVMQPPPKLPANASVNGFGLRVPTTSSTMSLASVHGPQFADICSPLGLSSISVSSSLSDLVGSPLEISVDNVVTIEELRQHLGSCFTCGVSWTDDHVSLDCSECGGYSLERPCPLCDGQCGVQWKRDFTMSHACGKARWHGVCPSYPEAAMHLAATSSANAAVATAANAVTTSAVSCASAATQLRLAQELCARLEQLSAGAHT